MSENVLRRRTDVKKRGRCYVNLVNSMQILSSEEKNESIILSRIQEIIFLLLLKVVKMVSGFPDVKNLN